MTEAEYSLSVNHSKQSVAAVEGTEPDAEATEVSNKHSESRLTPKWYSVNDRPHADSKDDR